MRDALTTPDFGNRPELEDRARLILIGLAFGVGLGLVMRGCGEWMPALQPWVDGWARHVLEPVGQVFLRLLLMVVVPLVGVSIATGVMEADVGPRWGRLAVLTFGLFGMNMAVAVGLGLLVMNWWEPGRGLSIEAVRSLLDGAVGSDRISAELRSPGVSPALLVDLFLPRNWFRAVLDFQILPVISFALLFGVAARALPTAAVRACRGWLDILAAVLFRIVGMAMSMAPVAVVALVSVAVWRVGPELLRVLAAFVVAVAGAMIFHLVVVLGLTVRFLGGRAPREFFRSIWLVLVTAFSTSSSAATLPTSLKTAREVLGIRTGTANFVLPLGATMNMSGTALYEGCVVLLVAQAYGVLLPWTAQMTLLVLAVLSAVAVASVPGASLPVIMGLLAQFGLPPEGIVFVLGVDRFLDMVRTTVNVAADLVTACVVDRMVPSDQPGSSPAVVAA
ncbi:MAG: dicarboxylate/amino acid:cation symporter [Verrucomicrobiota bacterium]|nr:dicarboxylate/amino acid:cation symporter [Limisphaera sp.]MDW8382859.1 dicarboxylate/amino acid:cation symporter [Verrucomicrobiota bacterium]